jgi:hypothetical protein
VSVSVSSVTLALGGGGRKVRKVHLGLKHGDAHPHPRQLLVADLQLAAQLGDEGLEVRDHLRERLVVEAVRPGHRAAASLSCAPLYTS